VVDNREGMSSSLPASIIAARFVHPRVRARRRRLRRACLWGITHATCSLLCDARLPLLALFWRCFLLAQGVNHPKRLLHDAFYFAFGGECIGGKLDNAALPVHQTDSQLDRPQRAAHWTRPQSEIVPRSTRTPIAAKASSMRSSVMASPYVAL
jgi:hypothetical protein